MPATVIDVAAADQPPVVQTGCGCQAALALLVVPVVLGIVAVLVMAPGPASADRWLLKGMLVALGGLLAVLGFLLGPVAVAARSMTGMADTFESVLYTTATSAASVASDDASDTTLRGRIEADRGHPLPRTPLSHRSCPWWRLTMHRLDGAGGDEGHFWSVVHEEIRATPFWLRDVSGRIRVDPAGANVTGITAAELEVYRADGEVALRNLDGKLRAAGLTLDLVWTPETVGFSAVEEHLPPGAEALIVGPTVVREGERMVAADDSGRPFTIAAVDGLGVVAAVRRTARRLQAAAIVVPVVGVLMVAGGFWWIVAG